jgi:hypothetical protein
MLMRWEGKRTQARDDEGILIDIVSCPNPAYRSIKVIDDEKRIFTASMFLCCSCPGYGQRNEIFTSRFPHADMSHRALGLRPSSIVQPWHDDRR